MLCRLLAFCGLWQIQCATLAESENAANTKLSNFIDRKFKIEVTGDSHFDVFLTGNIEKLNFNLMLKSNLKNSYLNIDYLDIVKKNNVKSSIKSEISILEGKIISLKDTYLK